MRIPIRYVPIAIYMVNVDYLNVVILFLSHNTFILRRKCLHENREISLTYLSNKLYRIRYLISFVIVHCMYYIVYRTRMMRITL